MRRSLYSSSLQGFKQENEDQIIGKIVSGDGFGVDSTQKLAWLRQIKILKKELTSIKNGHILFEYTIPRIGKRIDNVLICNGIIFLIEFKVGDDNYYKHAIDQVMDYALDLKYFHSESNDKLLVPILVSTNATEIKNSFTKYEDNITHPLLCNEYNIGQMIGYITENLSLNQIDATKWENSQYMPTPTIIEAAQALYSGHNVAEISRSDAGAINLNITTNTINQIIENTKAYKKKSICFITGVPGAGKTLAGLNIANERHNFDESEHAVFLSGNGPLVDVLQEALARNMVAQSTEKVNKSEALRKAKSFIQIIHHFRDEALLSSNPPLEKVTIFDEAQRAWTKEQTSKFMKTKKGQFDFNMSEPEFLIEYMDRHPDWAVIICLIGGGQEINTGEAGLSEWFDAIKDRFNDWDVYISDRIIDDEYRRGKELGDILSGSNAKIIPELHLAVSLRSFRSESVSEFVKNLLDMDIEKARKIYSKLDGNYKIVLTRDKAKAKNWLKSVARGTERYGLISSSGAIRLKAEGIFVKNEIDSKQWFLNDDEDVRSSYYLEDVATEFDIQGLELDYSMVAWGADYRYCNGQFISRQFRGNKWMNINKEDNIIYLKNAYRVLLTRARQGMVIYIPTGDDNDSTRQCKYYDETFEYLKSIGLETI